MVENCTLFQDKQHYCTVIYAVKQTVSSLELIGSLFIIFIIWLFKTYKYFHQRLILALSVAALGGSISFMLTGVPQERGTLCEFQAWLITYFVLSIILWNSCIAFNIWRASRGDRAKRLERYYHLISWGVPLISASLPIIKSVYGPAGHWCWVAGDVEHSAIWRFATHYIPLFICFIGIFVVFTYIFITHRRQAKRWEGIHSRNTAAEHEQRKLWKNHVYSLLAYPFIFLVLSMASFIHRIYNAISPEPSFVLIILHGMSVPLGGLFNAIAFGVNKETLRRLNWGDIKAAFQQHFPLGNPRMDSSIGEHRLGETTQTELPRSVVVIPTRYDNYGTDNNLLELSWEDARSDSPGRREDGVDTSL